jgi:hypothetical protein
MTPGKTRIFDCLTASSRSFLSSPDNQALKKTSTSSPFALVATAALTRVATALNG